MKNHEDVDRQELVPVLVDASGREQPRMARALLDLTPDAVETAIGPTDELDLATLQARARRLAEARAADLFGEA